MTFCRKYLAVYNLKAPLLPSELLLDEHGHIYHLGLHKEHIPEDIILVGDQGRVELIAEFFDAIEFTNQNREFSACLGTYNSKRILVLSTGIGTDNIDIVMNEIDALINIDAESRRPSEKTRSINLIRIGTCGLLHEDATPGDFIVSSGAIGLDNLGHFYDSKFGLSHEQQELLVESFAFPEKVIPYGVCADKKLTSLLSSDKTKTGWTITAPGFYAPQGRALRTKLSSPDMVNSFENSTFLDWPVLNFEMESSALFYLADILGHRASTICLGIANRPSGEFLPDYKPKMKELILYVLERL